MNMLLSIGEKCFSSGRIFDGIKNDPFNAGQMVVHFLPGQLRVLLFDGFDNFQMRFIMMWFFFLCTGKALRGFLPEYRLIC